MRVEGKVKGPSETKRFYMPGLKIYDNCPECGIENVWDGAEDYISYPPIGQPFKFNFYCFCNTEWQRMIVIDYTLTQVHEELSCQQKQ